MGMNLDDRLALMNGHGKASEIIWTAYRSCHRQEVRQVMTEDERAAVSVLCFLAIEVIGLPIAEDLLDFVATGRYEEE